MNIQRRVVISGRVQGVGYRYSTRLQARRLHLKGWVRNQADGSVEAVFQGPEETVLAMLKWCWQGPPAARVSGVDCFEQQLSDFDGEFDVRS